jgi:hypothetical protein
VGVSVAVSLGEWIGVVGKLVLGKKTCLVEETINVGASRKADSSVTAVVLVWRIGWQAASKQTQIIKYAVILYIAL